MAKTPEQLQKETEMVYKKRLGDYLSTFTSAHGKRVLKDMRRSYCGHIFSTNEIAMAYDLGKREVVKDIEAMLIAGKNPKAIEDLFRHPEDDGFDF
jgi:hypothetical protein